MCSVFPLRGARKEVTLLATKECLPLPLWLRLTRCYCKQTELRCVCSDVCGARQESVLGLGLSCWVDLLLPWPLHLPPCFFPSSFLNASQFEPIVCLNGLTIASITPASPQHRAVWLRAAAAEGCFSSPHTRLRPTHSGHSCKILSIKAHDANLLFIHHHLTLAAPQTTTVLNKTLDIAVNTLIGFLLNTEMRKSIQHQSFACPGVISLA